MREGVAGTVLLVLLPWGSESTLRADELPRDNVLEVKKARALYASEIKDLETEEQRKVAVLREKTLKTAEAGKRAASKKGDLSLALAWESFEKELLVEEPPPVAGEPSPASVKEVEKARVDYHRDLTDLRIREKRARRVFREKRYKAAEEEKVAATKKGLLDLAQAWDQFARELQLKPVNLARKAVVTVDAQWPNSPKSNMNDGLVDLSVENRKYWYTGPSRGKPHSALFRLQSPQTIRRVQFLVPVATKWNRNGHEPLDYDVILKLAGREKEKVSVRGGTHPDAEVSKDGKTQWIRVVFKKEVEASEVEFQCQKTSGGNWGPVVFEFEIWGEE
jgi:hypothetical protein